MGGERMSDGHFADRLVARVLSRQSHLVVGLDPRLDLLPAQLVARYRKEYGLSQQAAAMAILEFNRGIIDAVAELVPAVKPQMAFYEEYGPAGMEALASTVRYAQEKDLIVILDGKRNDIGSTAEAYTRAYLGGGFFAGNGVAQPRGVDAMTVNPYLGEDGVKPFISYGPEKGAFILVKTSNPASGQLQDLLVVPEGSSEPSGHARPLYEVVAGLVDQWGSGLVGKSGYSSVGAVVGATYPEVAKRLRALMPRAYFLVPGFGAQGATAVDAAAAFNEDGMGALVNVSRAVIYAFRNDPGYQAAARKAVLEINRQINQEVDKKRGK